MFSTFPFLLLLLIFICPARSELDFCDTDPWVQTTYHQCNFASRGNISSPRILIHPVRIHDNPYHALHETVWALAHYLTHCTKAPRNNYVLILPSRADIFQNFSSCTTVANNTTPPSWGACAIRILAHHIAIHPNNIVSRRVWTNRKRPPNMRWLDNCFDKTVTLGVKPPNNHFGAQGRSFFSRVLWYAHNCSTPGVSAQKRTALCNESRSDKATYVPLSDDIKKSAFRNLTYSVMRYLHLWHGMRPRRSKVRVLIYDRNDTKRRQWVNAPQFVRAVRKDPRVEVRFLQTTPVSFAEQVALYSWVDVVITPHGAQSASTIFMAPGTDIIELWGKSHDNVWPTRYKPRSWTGWHAPLLGLNLQYAQMHPASLPFRTAEQITASSRMDDGKEKHKALTSQLLLQYEEAVQRQMVRLEEEGVEYAHVKKLQRVHTIEEARTLRHATGMMLLLGCFSIVARRLTRRKFR